MKSSNQITKCDEEPTIITKHTFSTRLKHAGVSTEFIQEALGHTDIRTTENYLDGFENEKRKEVAGNFLSFKNT